MKLGQACSAIMGELFGTTAFFRAWNTMNAPEYRDRFRYTVAFEPHPELLVPVAVELHAWILNPFMDRGLARTDGRFNECALIAFTKDRRWSGRNQWITIKNRWCRVGEVISKPETPWIFRAPERV